MWYAESKNEESERARRYKLRQGCLLFIIVACLALWTINRHGITLLIRTASLSHGSFRRLAAPQFNFFSDYQGFAFKILWGKEFTGDGFIDLLLPYFWYTPSSLYYIRPGAGIVPVPPMTLAGRFVIACPYWLVIAVALVLFLRNQKRIRSARPA